MFESAIQNALNADNVFEALFETAVSMKDADLPKKDTLAQFETLSQKYAQTENETIYNAILDVMDCIVGWCSPHQKIYD